MRSADVLGLALEALWQQKVRTLLTTLGVVLGTTVLVISLSLGQGVQETVVREISRHGDLRTVEVRPGYSKGEVELPEKEREVVGNMSEERRERIRKEMVRRYKVRHRPPPSVKLTRDRLEELARLEHVRGAVVGDAYPVKASLGDRDNATMAVSSGLRDDKLRERLIAGDFFAASTGNEVLVSELLLYKLGVADDAELPGVVGRKLRVEFYGGPTPGLLLMLLQAGKAQTPAEEKVIDKVLKQLPRAIEKMEGLTVEDRLTLAQMLARAQTSTGLGERDRIGVELTVRGVLRVVDESEAVGRWSLIDLDADVVLPTGTAEELFAKLPDYEKAGYRTVLLEVDSIDNVRGVAKEVEGLGFGSYTLMQYVEAERYLYLMIFAGMSLIAVVALSVSALGIGNTMLMGVLERVREIGVMKAVGAGEGQIQMLFLIEGMLIGFVGGLLGLLLAWGLSIPGDAWVRSLLAGNTTIKLEQSLFVWPWWVLAGAPVFSCVLTTLAAVYPARRAAKVNTVEALRHE